MEASTPTIFHITHWKAGSQWIHRILLNCIPESKIVRPEVDEVQFLQRSLEDGKVYPTVYVTQEQFYSVRLPTVWKRFVVIRDLRDTLVSGYFSIRYSHKTIIPRLTEWREALHEMDEAEGLIFLMDEWLPASAKIQKSWQRSNEPIYRYEDLLGNDLDILETILLKKCQLPLEPTRFRQIVLDCRFEQMSGGRKRGEENVMAHERKGVAGDWRNHFDQQVTQAFKERFAALLIETGYEKDENW
jgi:sulfotransferase family protein